MHKGLTALAHGLWLAWIAMMMTSSWVFADTPIIRVFDVKLGFSANIYNAVQDPNGMFWLAQDGGGVLLFGGKRSYKSTTREGLPSNALNQVILTRSGKIWVTFSDSQPVWKHYGNLKTWELTPKPEIPGFIGGEALLETAQGEVILASNVGLLIWKDDQWKPWKTLRESEAHSQQFDYLTQIENGDIYGISELGKVWKLDPGEPHLMLDACSKSIRSMKLVEDPQKRLLLTGHPGSIMQLVDNTLVPAEPESSQIEEDIVPNHITVLKNGDLLVGTINHGVFQFRKGTLLRQISKRHGLPATFVQSIYEDRDGNWLVCTMGGGLALIVKSPFRNITESDGLGAPIVWQSVKRPDGTLRVLSYGNVITDFLPDGSSQVWKLTNLDINANVFGMSHREDGTVWVFGTGGAFLLDKNWNTIRALTLESGFPSRRIRHLYQEPDGTLLVLTNDKGLVIVTPNGEISSYDESRGLANQLWSMVKQKDGTLVFASDRGPVLFNLKTKQGRLHPAAKNTDMKLLTGVAIDPQDRLWFASARGAYCIDGTTVSHYTTENGLPHDNIYLVLVDKTGATWLGTTNGLAKICPQGHIHIFGYTDGILNPETNTNSGYVDEAGTLYFGTPSGVVILEKPEQCLPPGASKVLITHFQVSNKEWSGFNQIVPAGDTLHAGNLEYQQNDIRIVFQAPSAVDPNLFLYQTRLLGYEEEWSAPGENEPIHLKHLPPGNYTFQVRACNHEAVCNPEPAQVSFGILAPYWRRLPFQLSIALLLAALLYGIHRIRVRVEVSQRLELERMVKERTQEIRELSLRDPLTGLRNRRYVVEAMLDMGKPSRPFGQDKRHSDHRGMGVFMLDIDHFKRVNDTYGHDSGDMVLTRFSDILTLCLRKEDTVCRWGGEEFLVLTQRSKIEVLKLLGERMRTAVQDAEFDVVGGKRIRITCSVGMAPFPFYDMPVQHEPNWEEIKSIADLGLYRAKGTGRNKCILVRPGSLLPDVTEVTRMMTDLDWAEQMNYFVAEDATGFVYQPEPDEET